MPKSAVSSSPTNTCPRFRHSWRLRCREAADRAARSIDNPGHVRFDERDGVVTPLVDVVIAARNESMFIARSLEALRQQVYDPDCLAIYVVDSNSTDTTAQIARDAGV